MDSDFAFEREAFEVDEVIELRTAPPTLEIFPTAEGFYDYQNKRYIYQYRDHLGNVRVSYAKGSNGPEVLDTNDYYPFGMNFLNSDLVSRLEQPWSKYKYNGKELQETGMYDYGARFYMPDIGRWGVVDPLAEKYAGISPYVYVADNPINAIDPDGRYIIFVTKDGTNLQYRNGNFYFTTGDLKGRKYDGRIHSASPTLFKLARAYRQIEHSGDKVLIGILHKLEGSRNIHQVQEGNDNNVRINRGNSAKDYEGDGTTTQYNFGIEKKNSFEKQAKVPSSDLATVVHEMQHQYDYDIGNSFGIKDSDK